MLSIHRPIWCLYRYQL